MAAEDLIVAYEALSLSESREYLLFRPNNEKAWLRETFKDTPRYLFRVFTPRSAGMTDHLWTKSMAARNGKKNSTIDVFARDNDTGVADMLNTHLRWWKHFEDNFVSWTSSLLFALVYIFHLHANLGDRSAFEDIYLCIIDTTKFSQGVFLRDMDLIKAYSQFNEKLAEFEVLRSKPHWYFGEYLSQGALKIEDKCQIVSAQKMINRGLYNLAPDFETFSRWKPEARPPWTTKVVEFREKLHTLHDRHYDEQMQIVIQIAKLYEPHWILPVAANLAALLPPSEPVVIKEAFRHKLFTGSPLLMTQESS